ncbi:hypothetical protein M3936_14060 [Sutcliffiella horikoshii]|uniref:hypothetical protein n=1 Tax=Sutcliffiella horikoshii TaxID=79883 RepID=UPI00203EADBA|nr:hypothetical protein [Sutcliffiella horikoshii]MCM3618711.1 hypothetical protein [Sutcliffiella horikoshii]
MRIKEEITITKIKLDGKEVRIPEGLTELFNQAGVWRKEESEKENIKTPSLYHRKVKVVDGVLKTQLRYVGLAEKEKVS